MDQTLFRLSAGFPHRHTRCPRASTRRAGLRSDRARPAATGSCLQREVFDVGRIDYKLGGSSGLDLIETFGGRLSQTPLVILTGRGDHAIEIEATDAGAFAYLDKSELTPALLERTIRNVRVQFETEQELRQSETVLRRAKSGAQPGTFGLRQDEIIVRNAVSAALKLVGTSAELAGVSLASRVEAHLPVLLADRQTVDQMLLNLLSNAIKLTPRGGRVVLCASLGDRGLELVVEDSGPGIGLNDMDLAFEPHGPARRAPSRCTGIGLGLAIARTLVELQGGHLAIDSVSEQGTRVMLTFSACRLAAPQRHH